MSDSKANVIVNPIIHDAIRLTGVEGQELSDLKFSGVDIVTGSEHVFSMQIDNTPPPPAQSTHHFSPKAERPPLIHNRFNLLKVMGQGRFSTVYAAFDAKKKRKVALKIYRASDEFLEYFKHEVSLLDQISTKSHPNIVATYGNFVMHAGHDRHGVIIFELIKDTLKDLLRANKKGLPLPKVKLIANQVAKGLSFLHQHGLIHADIKPENLLINKSGVVKICDIGSGCRTDKIESFRVGTVPYIAPELLLGCSYDCKIDVWSLACLLFELATNACLFDPEIYFEENSDNVSESDKESCEQDNSSDCENNNASASSASLSCSVSNSSSEDEDDFFDMEITHFQLCHFRSLLGDFPHDLFHEGEYYTLFFNTSQQLRVVPRFIDDRSLAVVMVDDLEIHPDVAKILEFEILKLLKIDPRERPSASSIFIH